jgi:hypothetical protein
MTGAERGKFAEVQGRRIERVLLEVPTFNAAVAKRVIGDHDPEREDISPRLSLDVSFEFPGGIARYIARVNRVNNLVAVVPVGIFRATRVVTMRDLYVSNAQGGSEVHTRSTHLRTRRPSELTGFKNGQTWVTDSQGTSSDPTQVAERISRALSTIRR